MSTPVQRAEAQATTGKAYGPRYCLKAVRECFVVGAHDFTPDNGRDPLAREAWQFAQHKHPVSRSAVDRAKIPANVPGFFKDPDDPYGAWHVVVMCGGNKCRSTDIKRSGRLDLTTIETIEREWGLVFLGWTEDLNTKRVYTPPAAPTPGKPRPKSNWAIVRTGLLRELTSPAAKAIPKSRPVVRAFIRLTHRRLIQLPKS